MKQKNREGNGPTLIFGKHAEIAASLLRFGGWIRDISPQDSLLPAQFGPFLEGHPLDILFYIPVFIKPSMSPQGPLRERKHIWPSVYVHFFSVPRLYTHKWFRVTLKTSCVSRLIPDSKHRRRKKNNNRLIFFFFLLPTWLCIYPGTQSPGK